jgi:hypothetical protein
MGFIIHQRVTIGNGVSVCVGGNEVQGQRGNLFRFALFSSGHVVIYRCVYLLNRPLKEIPMIPVGI